METTELITKLGPICAKISKAIEQATGDDCALEGNGVTISIFPMDWEPGSYQIWFRLLDDIDVDNRSVNQLLNGYYEGSDPIAAFEKLSNIADKFVEDVTSYSKQEGDVINSVRSFAKRQLKGWEISEVKTLLKTISENK